MRLDAGCDVDPITDWGYEPSDPKHPSHHDIYADVYDAREGK